MPCEWNLFIVRSLAEVESPSIDKLQNMLPAEEPSFALGLIPWNLKPVLKVVVKVLKTTEIQSYL